MIKYLTYQQELSGKIKDNTIYWYVSYIFVYSFDACVAPFIYPSTQINLENEIFNCEIVDIGKTHSKDVYTIVAILTKQFCSLKYVVEFEFTISKQLLLQHNLGKYL